MPVGQKHLCISGFMAREITIIDFRPGKLSKNTIIRIFRACIMQIFIIREFPLLAPDGATKPQGGLHELL